MTAELATCANGSWMADRALIFRFKDLWTANADRCPEGPVRGGVGSHIYRLGGLSRRQLGVYGHRPRRLSARTDDTGACEEKRRNKVG